MPTHGRSPSAVADARATRLESILDGVDARVSVWDRDLVLRYANASAQDDLRFTTDLGYGHDLDALFPPHDAVLVRPALERALRGHEVRWTGTTSAGGSVRYVDHHLTPLRSGGRIDGLTWVGVDSTTETLSRMATAVYDHELAVACHRLQVANDVSTEVLHHLEASALRLEAALGGEVPELLAARAHVQETVTTAIAGLRFRVQALLEETQVHPVDEPELPLAVEVPVVPRIPQPHDHSWLSEAQLVRVLDSLPMPVSAVDGDLVVTFANAAARAFFGRHDDLAGARPEEFLGTEVWRASQPYAEAARAGRPQRFLRHTRDLDGLRRTVQSDYVPLLVRSDGADGADGGRVGGIVVLLLDVTERLRAEEELAGLQRRLALVSEQRFEALELLDPMLQRLFGCSLRLSTIRGDDAIRLRTVAASVLEEIHEILGSWRVLLTEAMRARAARSADGEDRCLAHSCAVFQLCSSVPRPPEDVSSCLSAVAR